MDITPVGDAWRFVFIGARCLIIQVMTRLIEQSLRFSFQCYSSWYHAGAGEEISLRLSAQLLDSKLTICLSGLHVRPELRKVSRASHTIHIALILTEARHGSRDPLWMKVYVGSLVALDTTTSIFTTAWYAAQRSLGFSSDSISGSIHFSSSAGATIQCSHGLIGSPHLIAYSSV